MATSTDQIADRAYHNFIDGQSFVSPDAGAFDVENPATEEVIAQAHAASEDDVALAVEAARRSFAARTWRGLTARDRGIILNRFADIVESRRAYLAEIQTLESGMPKIFADFTVSLGVESTRYYAGFADKIAGAHVSENVSSDDVPIHAYTTRVPVGVVAIIIPWNGPIASFMMKVAPALAAGCSVVVKPAENTPLTSVLLAEIAAEAGVPPGVINVVNGFGAGTGAALVRHPEVDKISFTGSSRTGKAIGEVAARQIKRVTLELGGKSANIIFADADMDRAVAESAMGVFGNAGQMCVAGSRLFVERRIFDEFTERLATFTRTLKMGDGLDPQNQLGPLISKVQFDRVASLVEQGRADGGEIVTGGMRQGDKGHFYTPTVFINAKTSSPIVQEEIFGPVVAVAPFDSEEEVVAEANATRYGLAAGLFTRDISRGHRVAAQLEAGTVWVNAYLRLHAAIPQGGFKESGIGREFGPEGLDSFFETKAVQMFL